MNDELRVLLACRNHWQWMGITGSINKDSYLPSNQWRHSCSCCEFIKPSTNPSTCKACPLNSFAWKSSNSEYGIYYYPCEYSEFSLYIQWKKAIKSSKTKYIKLAAERMVWACNQAIEALIIGGLDD